MLFWKGVSWASNQLYITTTLGFIVVSCLAGFYHLFLPIDFHFSLFLLVLAVVLLALIYRKQIQLPQLKSWQLSSYLLVAGLIIIGISIGFHLAQISALPSHHYDDGLYYRPYIKWLTTFKVVPGLGNLHFRLANNSTWHLLTAVFERTLLPEVYFNDLNGCLLLLIAITTLQAVYQLMLKCEHSLSNFLKILILIPLLLQFYQENFFTFYNYGIITSPAPDLPAAVFTWFTLFLVIEKIEKRQEKSFDVNTVNIVLIAGYVLTIKLSVAPIILVILLFFIIELRCRRWINTLKLSLLLLVLFSPWLISNTIQSGYLLFPFYQLVLRER